MNKKKIVKKCWSFTYKPDCSYAGHIFGETLAKAKYMFYLNTDGYGFMEFFKDYSFKREPRMDLLEPIPMDILKCLTEQQKRIIFHANGNESKQPGTRSHYNLSDPTNSYMKGLVALGLMHEPLKYVGGNSYNWFLTELGTLAAMSVLPIQSDQVDTVLKERNQITEWLNTDNLPLEPNQKFCLEMFKINPSLKKLLNGLKVLIVSGQWGTFWRDKASGYTCESLEAGHYDFDDAFSRTRHCGKEKQISFQII